MKKINFLIIITLFYTLPFYSKNINTRPIPNAKFSGLNSPKPQPDLKKQFTLKGYIKAPQDWKSIPEFRFFFNGQETVSDKNGFYSFKSEKNIDKLYILACKDIKPSFNGINTIKNLNALPKNQYKMFSFKKLEKKWIQKEKSLEKKDFVLPKNCMVAIIKPKYIENITNWNINLSDNFIKLPQIILKADFPEKKVQREAAKSLIRSLDSVTFHEPIKIYKKNNKGHLITLAK
ncbi:hypothetical protein ACFLYH_02500 [Candidatus Dependentiae bacterium]